MKGIGPKTALKRIRDWGSLERAPPEVRDMLPTNLQEIRDFFLAPPVSDEAPPPSRNPDSDGILGFLCDERGFARARVAPVLRRLRDAARPSRRLEDFG